MIDRQILDQHGVTEGEYARILELLGREPNLLELGLFSVMWSEHCSYKSSRVHLKTLPTTGPRVVQGPGENAGAVDIGEGRPRLDIDADDGGCGQRKEHADAEEISDESYHARSIAREAVL